MQKLGMSTGRLRDPAAGRPGDEMIGCSGVSLGSRSHMVSKFNSEAHFTFFQRLLETL